MADWFLRVSRTDFKIEHSAGPALVEGLSGGLPITRAMKSYDADHTNRSA
jgi:hypothetical protein